MKNVVIQEKESKQLVALVYVAEDGEIKAVVKDNLEVIVDNVLLGETKEDKKDGSKEN